MKFKLVILNANICAINITSLNDIVFIFIGIINVSWGRW